MDPGLAGVIVPTVALVAIAAIPYIDRSPLGVGILGTSAKGRRIIGFTAVYTTVVLVAMIVLDEMSGHTIFGIETILKTSRGQLPRLRLGGAVRRHLRLHRHPDRRWSSRSSGRRVREMIIALFTGFVVSYIVLTISGTSFRGPGQDLMMPWQLPLEHH